MEKKNVISRLGNKVDNSASQYKNRFTRVEGSALRFSSEELEGVTDCCLRTVKSKKFNRTDIKIHVLVEMETRRRGKLVTETYEIWAKLDSASYHRYKDEGNISIDPKKVVFYLLTDPEHEYGKEENDWSWYVVRIAPNAKVSGGCGGISDEELFGETIPY